MQVLPVGNADPYSCAFTGFTVDAEARIDGSRAFTHSDQTRLAFEEQGIEAFAIVLDGHLDMITQVFDGDLNFAGFGMVEDIVQGFLADTEKVDPNLPGKPRFVV